MNILNFNAIKSRIDLDADSVLYFFLLASFFLMPIGTGPMTAAGILSLVVFIFSGTFWKKKEIIYRRSWFLPVIFYIFLHWIGLVYSPDPGDFGLCYAEKNYYWLFSLTLAGLCFRRFSSLRLIQAFMAGLGINAVIAIFQLILHLPNEQGRYHGIGPGYTTLSTFLILAMLMTSFFYRNNPDRSGRIRMLLLTGLYFFHLAILESRTGYVAFIFILPLIAYNFLSGKNMLAIFLVTLVFLGGMSLSPMVRQRIRLSVEQVKYHLNASDKKAWGMEYSRHQDRFYMWRGALRIIKEHPFIGIGTGGYRAEMKKRSKPDVPFIAHPHNNLLYMMTSFGIFGVISFFWLFFEMIKNGWIHRHSPAGQFVLGTALVIIISGMFNTQIINAGPLFLLTLAFGLQESLPKFQELTKK